MNKATLGLTGLFVVLGIAVYFMFIAPSGNERVASYSPGDVKVSFDSTAIARLDIARSGKTVTLENQGGKWMVTSPVNYKANASSVAQLVGGISHFKVGSLISSNPAKQNMFQVDSLGTKVTITDRSKKSQTLIVGKPGPSYTDVYFRLDGSKDVYLGEGIVPYILNQEAREWRDKSIYTSPSDSITQFAIEYGPRQYVLKKEGGSWTMNGDSIATSEVTPVLSNLSNLSADDFIDSIPKPDLAPIRIQIAGNNPADLKFYPQPPDSARYIVQSSSTPQVFSVSKWVVQQITKPVEPKGEAKQSKKKK